MATHLLLLRIEVMKSRVWAKNSGDLDEKILDFCINVVLE